MHFTVKTGKILIVTKNTYFNRIVVTSSSLFRKTNRLQHIVLMVAHKREVSSGTLIDLLFSY